MTFLVKPHPIDYFGKAHYTNLATARTEDSLGYDDPHKQDMFIESLKTLIRKHSIPDLSVSAVLTLRMSAALPGLLIHFATAAGEASLVESAIQEAASFLPSSHLLAHPAEIAKTIMKLTPEAYLQAFGNRC